MQKQFEELVQFPHRLGRRFQGFDMGPSAIIAHSLAFDKYPPL
jgi:hypothetical protein